MGLYNYGIGGNEVKWTQMNPLLISLPTEL